MNAKHKKLRNITKLNKFHKFIELNSLTFRMLQYQIRFFISFWILLYSKITEFIQLIIYVYRRIYNTSFFIYWKGKCYCWCTMYMLHIFFIHLQTAKGVESSKRISENLHCGMFGICPLSLGIIVYSIDYT